MQTKIMSIDPGKSGGFACLDIDGKVWVSKMPETVRDISGFIRSVNPGIVVIEKVGYHFKGNSASSSVTFGRHVGSLEGIMCALELPQIWVAPQKWMGKFIGTGFSEKKDRKNAIKNKCQLRYPHIKVTLAVSDALGLLNYYMENHNE